MMNKRKLLVMVLFICLTIVGCTDKEVQQVEEANEANKVTEIVEEEEKEEEVENKESEDSIEPVIIDLSESNYDYYLGARGNDPNNGKSILKKIFGFNMPEGYDTAGYATNGSQEMPELTVYEEMTFSYLDEGYFRTIVVEMIDNPGDVDYLKEFLSSDEYTEWKHIGDSCILNSLEKGAVVETPYGSVQVIYQIATRDSGTTIGEEIALFKVNNYDIMIKYNHDGKTVVLEGELEKLLPEMLQL